MRVLFLSHSFPRRLGDAPGSFLLRLAQALQEQNVEVRAIVPSAEGLPEIDRLDGVTVERFRYAPRRFERLAYTGNMAQEVRDSWRARLTMLSFLGSEFVSAVRSGRRFHPDVVHAHWWFPGGLVGTWVASLADVPLVTTVHGTDVRLARAAPAARPVFRHVVHRSQAVTAVSHWLAHEVRDLVPSAQPHVAPMPVDTERFTPGAERATDRLLFVGRLNAQKGVEHLIAALGELPRHVMLDVVGDGPDRARLLRQAAEVGVGERIAWHGSVPQPELVPFYRRATVLVVPSIEEGLGLVAVEAHLCGTPVVASRSGGLPDVVRDGQTGVLVPPADARALATALRALLADPARQRALGEAGRMHALATFAPASVARRYASLYHSVLGSTSHR